MALGNRGGHLVVARAVQLRGPAGARPRSAVGAFEAHLDDAGLGQLVEVESRHRAGDAQSLGGFVQVVQSSRSDRSRYRSRRSG